MLKKIILLLSAAIVIACMSLPAMANGYGFYGADICTHYHNTHLENQGVMYLATIESCKFKIGISKGSGNIQGDVTYTTRSDNWIYGSYYSGWVDCSYQCDTVRFTQVY